MDIVTKALTKKSNELKAIIHKTEQSLQNAPEGSLRIDAGKKNPQYYVLNHDRRDGRHRTGTYLKKENQDLAAALAQKGYDRSVINAANTQEELIGEFLAHYDERAVSSQYDKLSGPRKKLVKPHILGETQFAEQWLAEQYTGQPFSEAAPVYFTNRHERVRSKSEVIIANKLEELGVPYKYEKPVVFPGGEVRYPDFTCLNVRLRREYIWEHFGKCDDPEYVRKNIRKMRLYEQNNIFPGEKLIMSYETVDSFDIWSIEALIRHYLL